MASNEEHFEPLFRKLGTYLSLSDEQRGYIINLTNAGKAVGQDTTLLEQGAKYDHSGILANGWAIQYKTLSDGRRQVVNFLLPGTFIGLQAAVFERCDHGVTTLTDGVVYWFEPERLVELIKHDPRLGMAILWNRTQEEAILMERLVSLGQRSAKERLAHILIELWYRLELRGLDDQKRMPFPVGQAVLADLLGLTTVHINRTLKVLKNEGLIDYDRKTVSLLDMDTLLKWADFDESYLHSMPMLDRTHRFISD
jgi:CRP-like cAMP-binding protein